MVKNNTHRFILQFKEMKALCLHMITYVNKHALLMVLLTFSLQTLCYQHFSQRYSLNCLVATMWSNTGTHTTHTRHNTGTHTTHTRHNTGTQTTHTRHIHFSCPSFFSPSPPSTLHVSPHTHLHSFLAHHFLHHLPQESLNITPLRHYPSPHVQSNPSFFWK